MKPLGEAVAKAARHRKFHWCRRPNGFSDLPIWRVVSAQCNLPLYQVVAFANRLEELANASANFGDVRGSLERFKPAEFGAALGMSADEAARIYAALEDPAIGWISFDHIADFYDRNPDREEDNAAERKRRQRSRDKVRKLLAKLAAQGKVDEVERRSIEIMLKGISDTDLMNLSAKLARAELSTGHEGHVVTSRDIVTVTPEQITNFNSAVVDNSEQRIRGEADGPAMGEDENPAAEATRWIDTDGKRLIVEYLQIRTQLAETYIERWRRDLNDDESLARFIKGADGAGYIGARFHTIITDQIKRHIVQRDHGPALPLMPPRPPGLKRSTSNG